MNRYLPLFLLALIAFSCKENSTQKTSSSSSENTALNHLKALDDSCSKAWNMMIDSDNQKIKDIQRLLQEISYIPGHNEQEVERLSEKAKKLSAQRYEQESMTSEAIDAYDQATDALLREVFNLKRNTKDVERYTLTEELQNSILQADGDVVNYRVLYDRWAQYFNDALEKAPAQGLSEKALKSLKKKNKFEL